MIPRVHSELLKTLELFTGCVGSLKSETPDEMVTPGFMENRPVSGWRLTEVNLGVLGTKDVFVSAHGSIFALDENSRYDYLLASAMPEELHMSCNVLLTWHAKIALRIRVASLLKEIKRTCPSV